MKKILLGIFVCMLLIAATVLPVTGTFNDKNNLERKKKMSFHWYKNIIETRGEEL